MTAHDVATPRNVVDDPILNSSFAARWDPGGR